MMKEKLKFGEFTIIVRNPEKREEAFLRLAEAEGYKLIKKRGKKVC